MLNWLITGVGSGLGRALALAALNVGDRVAGTVRGAEALTAFQALAPDRAIALHADMADEGQVRAAVADAIGRLGGLDILVNNAGYGLLGGIEEASLDEIRAQFAVNVLAPVIAIQAVLPHFRERSAGRVINITSVSGLAPWAGTGVYGASKYALEGIGQTLAQEVAPFGIKVTNVEPGSIRTDFAGRSQRVVATKLDAYADGSVREAERILSEGHGHQPGDPARMAAAILAIAKSPDPPLQLLLGADAVHYALQAAARFQDELGRFAQVSLSTSFV